MSDRYQRACVAAATGLLITTARAATQQYVVPVPAVTYANLTGNTQQTVSAATLSLQVPVPQYDQAHYGPLTSVDVTLDVTYDLTFDNGPGGGGASVALGGNELLGGNAYGGLGTGNGTSGPPNSHLDVPVHVFDSVTLDLFSGAAKALIGTGTTPFDFHEGLDVVIHSFAGGDAQFFLQSGGTYTVTYSYVPEPAIAVSAVFPVLLGRRRRRVG